MEEVDGEVVLYDPVAPRLLVLNATGAAVWRRCDGSMTVRALVRALIDALGAPPEQVGADVDAFLRQLLEAGLLA